MSRSLCSKDLYCTFLRVTSQRYSALSLSEVLPDKLSQDSISIWLVGMLNFLWIDDSGVCPMDFRIYEPREDDKTKNDHFRDLLKLDKRGGVKPEAVVADSWYSSLDNLKCIRDLEWNWVMGLRKNRIVNRGEKLEKLKIPDKGLKVHLQGYG